MKILLAGANSYIGSRLLPFLLDKGHKIVYLARDKKYFADHNKYDNITVLNGDLLRRQSIEPLPEDIDVTFYLANRLTQTSGFAALEALSAQNFMDKLNLTQCKQVITVGAVGGQERSHVEGVLAGGKAALTGLRTSMVIGEGSIAIELFEALTQNKPIVITKTWAKTMLQPVYIGDVLTTLDNCLLNKSTYNHLFDIGGPQQLTLKQMMLLYIAMNKEDKPDIVILPFLSSKLASYLVNFLSPISYPDAQEVIQNLDRDSICENINPDIMPAAPVTFKQSLKLIHDKSGETVLA